MNSWSDREINDSFSAPATVGELIKDSLYPNSIDVIVDGQTFLGALSSSIDVQGNAIAPFEIPGMRTICGNVNGNRFMIRKAGAFSNPFAKDVVGVVEESQTGVVVKYNLVSRPGTTLFQTICLIALIGFGVICLMSVLSIIDGMYPQHVIRLAMLYMATPVFLLVLFVAFCRGADISGESDQEELLDHIKKLAAGITVSS